MNFKYTSNSNKTQMSAIAALPSAEASKHQWLVIGAARRWLIDWYDFLLVFYSDAELRAIKVNRYIIPKTRIPHDLSVEPFSPSDTAKMFYFQQL